MEPDTNSSQPRVIPVSEILAKIERGEPVVYDGVIVEGELDLPTEHVERTESEIGLGLAEETKLVMSPINITNSEIRGNVSFGNVIFRETIDFRWTNFSGDAYFRAAEFRGDADFEVAQFSGDAYFGEAEFRGDANFGGAQFGGYAYFVWAQFSGDADFWGAQFSGDANFEWAQFSGDADFGRTKFDKDLSLDNLKFDRLYITWNSIRANLVYDGPAYLALIKNFKTIERFSDADDCYYQYRKVSQARKKWYSEENRLIEYLVRCYDWTSANIKRISEYLSWINDYPPFTWIHRFNWSKLLDCIGSVSCGYGVRIGPIILWVFGSVLGFTFLYKLLPKSYGGIIESGPSTVTMGALNNSTLLLTFSSGDCAVSPSWGECLYFSFTALTGGTPDGLHPVGLCKYVVMIEGVLGYMFLALFVVVLARKLIR